MLGTPILRLKIQGSPGLTSWVILSRPYGTGPKFYALPRTASWAILSRPYGTDCDPTDS
jgi:hypothetical protein